MRIVACLTDVLAGGKKEREDKSWATGCRLHQLTSVHSEIKLIDFFMQLRQWVEISARTTTNRAGTQRRDQRFGITAGGKETEERWREMRLEKDEE